MIARQEKFGPTLRGERGGSAIFGRTGRRPGLGGRRGVKRHGRRTTRRQRVLGERRGTVEQRGEAHDEHESVFFEVSHSINPLSADWLLTYIFAPRSARYA